VIVAKAIDAVDIISVAIDAVDIISVAIKAHGIKALEIDIIALAIVALAIESLAIESLAIVALDIIAIGMISIAVESLAIDAKAIDAVDIKAWARKTQIVIFFLVLLTIQLLLNLRWFFGPHGQSPSNTIDTSAIKASAIVSRSQKPLLLHSLRLKPFSSYLLVIFSLVLLVIDYSTRVET